MSGGGSARSWVLVAAAKLKTYERNAAAKGRVFALSRDEAYELFRSPCNYCQQPPSEKLSGIDRVDNRGGYILDNVVACCSRCNFLKGSLDQGEFVQLCAKIARHKTSPYFQK